MAVTAVMALFILTFTGQTFAIPSGSMENTLLIGDHLVVNRSVFDPTGSRMPLVPHRDVRRGDIIVFLKPGEPDLRLVKRVIGVPGDRVRLRDGIVYLNGEPQSERYVIRSQGDSNAYRDNFPSAALGSTDPLTPAWRAALPGWIRNGELVVPEGMYFAMGDNRDVSLDSRYWGFVPRENILGTPLFIYWSFDTPGDEYLKTGLGERVVSMAKTAVHFFDQTRWRRTLRRVQ
jgi:signal peptidase I